MFKSIVKSVYKKKLSELKKKITPTKKQSISHNKNYQKKIERILSKKPEKILEFIKRAKTPIYKANIKQQGFISPKKGLKALYLNLVLNKKIGFSTTEIFVIPKNNSLYTLSYEFYKWYCFKKGIKGFEEKTQNNFEKIFTLNKDDLTFDEIIELKEAIARDIEAINFVKEFAMKTSMAKKNHRRIAKGETVKI